MINSSSARSLKVRQVGIVETFHYVNGTAGTPADSGVDALFTDSVTDIGAGRYKITFKQAARQVVNGISVVPVTVGVIPYVFAVDVDSVTIYFKNEAGVFTDADFYFSCLHSMQLSEYF